MRHQLRNAASLMTSSNRFKVATLLFLAVFLAMGLLGCRPHVYAGNVESITVSNATPMLNDVIEFRVHGTGNCQFRINFGDNSFFDPGQFYSIGGYQNGFPVAHMYTGWPGTRTVSVEGIADGPGDCSGKAEVKVLITPPLAIAFVAPNKTCQLVPNQQQLLPGWSVHITTNPSVKINFGCALGGCSYDANGEPNSTAPSNYPFPGLRKYSLVLKVGTQVVQGGSNVTFTANQVGALELCVNDDNLSGNSGAWGIFIDVNT
ncbi:MAG TPA: hypothetical protein VFD70_16600 [Anaerolineae bacterium]|nr:hypothetical protein [Anaerolineae bacterium]